MRQVKSMIIVYELYKTLDGLLDERPIFNCDTIEEARVIFAKKWNIKTSKQALSYQVKCNRLFKEKYKIFKINL